MNKNNLKTSNSSLVDEETDKLSSKISESKVIDEDASLLTFEAISEFVNELSGVFCTAKSPLSLYKRILEHINKNNSGDSIQKCISGFAGFFANYEDSISTLEKFKTIPRDTVIRYGDSKNVYLEIQKYIYKSKTDDERNIIRSHLLTIAATIDPSEKSLANLNSVSPLLNKFNLDASSKEGQFVANVIQKAQKTMSNNKSDDPTTAIMGLLSSGLVGDMISGLQAGVETGSMDVSKLFSSMQSALTGVMDVQKENLEEVMNSNNNSASNQTVEDCSIDEDHPSEKPEIDMDKLILNVQNTLKPSATKAGKKSKNSSSAFMASPSPNKNKKPSATIEEIEDVDD